MQHLRQDGTSPARCVCANDSFYQPPVLLLDGIPGMDRSQHRLVSILFCAFYLVALLGNCTILFIIKRTPGLHEPMYFFFSMLAVTDLGLVVCTLPTTLGIFWFDVMTIGFDVCLAQMYFIHIVSVLESSVLLVMAVDRFLAISYPLRYKAILTKPTIIKIGLVMLVRSAVSLLPIPFLLKRLTYCSNNSTLSHSFCFHPDIMKLACGDIRVNIHYGLVVVLSTAGVDSVLIVFSYFLIIRTVFKLGSRGNCWKALNTCVSHICAVLIFFIPMIGLSMIHRFGNNVPPIIHTVVAFVYLIVPPVLNPIIYSIKSKQIRKAILRILLRKTDAL
ncbi:olfactory receptor 51G2-like [Hemicordylus capensis]|uniref:olfactory receptor 51G2-like n=1 Tax=Hemicordylus capensis TaxID=884348 RepID=UPI002303DF2D|nr:olfactory receptor 51G2-like [Hemicordylus capensis]XP_053166329.1 olfactory receptor 51G2-like [Hemicordylus capensis]